MNHIFGPVNSRRLGRSLGVDLLPPKICNLNCIYCEVGPTTMLTCDRAEYTRTDEILDEIEEFCKDGTALDRVDVITVTGSGEPTLHSEFGTIVSRIRERCGKPVAVLTNGTTMTDAVVRRELALADIVIPSLDSARSESFRRLDRPARCLDLDAIIQGLITFSRKYQGQIWLEILLVRGINDTDEEVEALITAARQMRLNRVQLNTVARPPLESWARPLEPEKLAAIAARFDTALPGVIIETLGEGAAESDKKNAPMDLSDQELGKAASAAPEVIDEIVQMLKRRPCTVDDIDRVFALGGPEKVEQLLAPLVTAGQVAVRRHKDRVYYH